MKYTRHAGEDFDETTCMLGDDCRNKKGEEKQTPDDKKITSDMIGDGVFYSQVDDKGEKTYCHKKCVDPKVSEYRKLHDLNDFFTKEDKWTIKEENLAEDDEGGEGGDGNESSD